MLPIQRMLIGLVRGGLKRNGWTQKRLADTVGIDERRLTALLNGYDRGSLTMWQRLLDALDAED